MATKTLILLRHAKSSWKTPGADIHRPLSDRGLRDAEAAGAILAEYPIDVVLCSDAVRARQTWEQAAVGGASCADVRYSEEIYQSWADGLLGQLRELEDEAACVALIGHQPTLSDLIVEIANPSKKADAVQERFPTCSLVVLSVTGSWHKLGKRKAAIKRFEIPRG